MGTDAFRFLVVALLTLIFFGTMLNAYQQQRIACHTTAVTTVSRKALGC